MIRVNGENLEMEKINLLELVMMRNLSPDRIAVELNGKIVRRGTYEEIDLTDGDKVEIVCFVGGG